MNTFVALSLILGASAVAVPRSSCSFELTASGGESGTIGQLSDGQNRIGGGFSPATFTINNGGIIDSAGRGCILTRKLTLISRFFITNSSSASVEQFQCDQGVSPTYSFAIDNNDTLTYSGSSVFYACPASDTEWNLYTTSVTGQLKCVEISLSASGCGAATSVAPSVTTVTVYDCGLASSTSAVTASTSPVAQSSTPATIPSVPAGQGSTTTASVPIVIPPTASESIAPIASSSSERYSSTTTIVATPTETTSVWSHSYVASTPESSVSNTVSTLAIITPPISTFTSPPTYPNTTLYTSSFTTYPNTALYTRPTATTSSTATSVQSSSTCIATTLTGTSTSGNYQWPHLIIPISSSTPTTASGTSYFGTISSNTSTIFNFDIPTSYSSSTCNLIFLLPLLSQLETSSYAFSGSGGITFEQLSAAASEATSWDSAPSVEKELGQFVLTEGSSTLVESFACPAGETIAFEMSAVGETYLYYFQDWNPSPLGMYITVC
jgi:hypothetical protein